MLPRYASVILWAQWRSLRNYYPRSGVSGTVFSALATLLWYGIWTGLAAGVANLVASPDLALQRILPGGLLSVFIYWQVVPVIMASTGASLQLKRLLVYPVPRGQLFFLEVLLRLSTGAEMLLLLAGASVGLLRNPAAPRWGPLVFVPFALFNLFLSAGIRDLLTRMLARKRVRELAVFALVLLAALPQLLVFAGAPKTLARGLGVFEHALLPWSAAGRVAAGTGGSLSWAIIAGWTFLAFLFGRSQFARSLRMEQETAVSTRTDRRSGRWSVPLFRWPSLFFRDPLAVLIEKELRTLSRSPRFRLVFFMGFSFGLIIWLPLAFGDSGNSDSTLASNYLTVVSVYAVMLLADALFWNCLGFDRSAVQLYFVAPVRIATVLIAKNAAAAIFVLLEILAVALVCALLRMPITPAKVFEACLVAMVLTSYLLGLGNLGSMHHPRAVDPAQTWRSNAAKGFQALLLLIYPFICAPVLLAYLARYAFASDLAFYLVLAAAAIVGLVIYTIALESACAKATRHRERIIAQLSASERPVS